jgi:hypothetical protein
MANLESQEEAKNEHQGIAQVVALHWSHAGNVDPAVGH